MKIIRKKYKVLSEGKLYEIEVTTLKMRPREKVLAKRDNFDVAVKEIKG